MLRMHDIAPLELYDVRSTLRSMRAYAVLRASDAALRAWVRQPCVAPHAFRAACTSRMDVYLRSASRHMCPCAALRA